MTNDDEDDEESESHAKQGGHSRRAVNRKLLDFLRVFSKFVNPKSLYMADRIRNLYLELLSKNDKDVQVPMGTHTWLGVACVKSIEVIWMCHWGVQAEALRCLLTYKHGYLNAHKETLEALLDEDKFRDALAKFDIAEDSGHVAKEHRPQILNVWRWASRRHSVCWQLLCTKL